MCKRNLAVLSSLGLMALGSVGAPAQDATGTLRVVDLDKTGRTNFVCTLQGPKEKYEVTLVFDPAARTMTATLPYPISFHKGRTYTFSGTYNTLRIQDEGKPASTTYGVPGSGYGYDLSLTYTDGVDLPSFGFGANLKTYRCE